MSSTQDNLSYEKNMSTDGSVADKPYLSKDLIYIIDNNGSTNYSRNQVEFETTSMSSNGKWCDYSDGFISIPVVTVLTSSADFVAGDHQNGLLFKSDYCNIIDSVTIDYGNNNKIQQNANISPYLVFKKHTTFSEGDVLVNGHTLGYRKDSHRWTYETAAGIVNCVPSALDHPIDQVIKHTTPQMIVIGNTAKTYGDNVYEEVGARIHVFYHDCVIRLKDLMFFQDMPMIRGANIKITIRLNQGEITNTRAGGVSTAMTSQLMGSVFPIMRRNLVDAVEHISVRVVENGVYKHQKNQCRLYCPVYVMSPDFERNYLSISQKKVTYEDVLVKPFREQSGSFNLNLTQGLSRMCRLIIVPMLSKSGNGTLKNSPQETAYTTEPSTCSPYYIRDFNVKLSSNNVYNQAINFKYETFLNEMNGVFGVNSNKITGLNSSLISQRDYNENFGYIVVDLSRRYEYDDNTPMSVEIQGHVASPKNLDLMCYITYLKDTTIDLLSGAEIA